MVNKKMPNENPTKSQVKSSVSAIVVAMAFTRALATKFNYLFSKAQLLLATHLWQTGRQSLSRLDWAFSGLLVMAPYAWQRSFVNAFVSPGYDAIILLRKRMIAHKIKEAIAHGATQIVFLGGGYDIRALITASENPDVNVFELDRGPTREYKIKGLQTIPAGIGFDQLEMKQVDEALRIGNNLYYINGDLAKDNLKQILLKYSFDPKQKSFFIVEGLTMYLNRDQNRSLLAAISDSLNENSECLISYNSSDKIMGSLKKKMLKNANEPHQFFIPPNDVIQFTREAGFAVSGKFDATRYLEQLNESDATFYKNDTVSKEYYYLLQKTKNPELKTIDQIPNINIDLNKL